MTDSIYWHCLNLVPEIGPQRFKRLYGFFETMKQAWEADFSLLQQAGLEDKIIEKILSLRKEIDPEKEIMDLERKKIKIISIKDKDYPFRLKQIYNPPALLYFKGSLKREDVDFSLAVVGTRKASFYGKEVTLEIVRELSSKGLTIVSGLAYGIDSLAHQEAINSKGKTIAVLGSGLAEENIYPPINRKLAEKIIGQGAIISEYPPNTPALPQHFPARNRIISGLCLGVLVIEAPKESGALLTAQHALDQEREVFAVPQNINSPNSQGVNQLINQGAKLVQCAEDIFEELNLANNWKETFSTNNEMVFDSKEEETVLKYLSKEPIHIDQLIQKTDLDPSQMNSLLISMEIKGMIRDVGGMNYILV